MGFQAGQGRRGGKATATMRQTTEQKSLVLCAFFFVQPQCKGKPHPSSFDQLPSEFFGGVVERELLTAQVVDWWVALQVEEKIVVEKHLLWLLLAQKQIYEMVLVFQQWQACKHIGVFAFLATVRHLPAQACFTT